MRLEIQAVDGHFVLFGATVYAAGGYGEAERLGLFLAGREEIFFSEEGAEGGDTNSPPVGTPLARVMSADSAVQIVPPKGTKCSITSR